MIQDHLRRFPRFDSLSDDEIRVLERAFDAKKLRKGHVVIREGDRASGGSASMYLVLEGCIEVAGRRLGRGELVGLIALVRDTRRTATVTVTEPALIARVDRDALRRLGAQHPAAWAKFQEVVARQLVADFRALHERLGEALG